RLGSRREPAPRRPPAGQRRRSVVRPDWDDRRATVLAFVPAWLLLAGACAVAVVSRQVPGRLAACAAAGRVALHRGVGRSGGRGRLATVAGRAASAGVGGVQPTALCRCGGGAEVPGPLQLPGRLEQRAAAGGDGGNGQLPLQGLPAAGQGEDADLDRDGVRAAVLAARVAAWPGAGAPLRIAGQPRPGREGAAVPTL